MGGELAVNGKTIKEISEIISQVFDPREIVMDIKIHNKASLNNTTVVSRVKFPLNIAPEVFGDYKTLYTRLDTYSVEGGGLNVIYRPCIVCGIVIKED